jgi:hypothetical protein
MAQVIIEEFRSLPHNSLLGFARVRMPSGMIFSDCAINWTAGRYWAAPASKPQVNRDGVCLRGKDGKILYVTIVGFASKELRDKFSDAILDALRASHPEALAP